MEWLKDKFKDDGTYEKKWQDFKKLCSKQIEGYDNGEEILIPKVSVIESRLCFMGENLEDDKKSDKPSNIALQLKVAANTGDLQNWNQDKASDGNTQPYQNLGKGVNYNFGSWSKTNYKLWSEFKKDKGEGVEEDGTEGEFDGAWTTWYGEVYIQGSASGDLGNKKLLKKFIENIQ